MEIFHELYGRYYQNMTRILVATPCTREVIQQIIKEQGFEESMLFLLPEITDKAQWNLLEREGEIWYSKLLYEPYTPTTTLERRWLKTQLKDERTKFLLSEELRTKFLESLKEETELYSKENFDYFDRDILSDPYQSENYQKIMRTVLTGLYRRTELLLTYCEENSTVQNLEDERKKGKTKRYLPLKMVYSMKKDRFFLYVLSKEPKKHPEISILKMRFVTEAKILPDFQILDCSTEKDLKRNIHSKYALIRIHDERGALERFMIQMTDFEKETREEGENMVMVKVYYRPEQTQELIRRFLSMGPMLEVVEPEEIRMKIIEKIEEQVRRFF